MKHLLLAIILAAAGSCATAATYTYSSPVYTAFNDFTNPCATPICANFTPGMRLQGQLVVAGSLAPNLANAEITPLLTSFNFSDGLTTYDSTDPQVRVSGARVSTDAFGALTAFDLGLLRWQQPAAAHVPGDRVDLFFLGGGGVAAAHNLVCGIVAINPQNNVPDFCTGQLPDASTSLGSQPTGVLPVLLASGAISVPTMHPASLLLLAAVLGALAFRQAGRSRRS